jgi:hypothetical protein
LDNGLGPNRRIALFFLRRLLFSCVALISLPELSYRVRATDVKNVYRSGVVGYLGGFEPRVDLWRLFKALRELESRSNLERMIRFDVTR